MSVGIFTAALTHHLRLDFQPLELRAGSWPGLEQTCLALSSGDTDCFPQHRPPRAPAQGLLLAGLTQLEVSELYLQAGGLGDVRGCLCGAGWSWRTRESSFKLKQRDLC